MPKLSFLDSLAHQLVIDWNIGKAYLRAGYNCKPASSRRNGLRLMTTNAYVQEKNAERVEEQKKAASKNAKAIIAELERLGFSNMKDYLSFGKDGIKLKESNVAFSGGLKPIFSSKLQLF